MTNTQTINSWIYHPKPNTNANLRLFCFPYAGGGASIFSSWSKILTSDVEICPLELPGHRYRITERPFARMKPLIDAILLV
ncbi:MAG: hypothetical protein HC930_09215 [Hydrococcus sp. SU_1_0]|nr:hypothetical protein [Hydrococcus sp. SU_1_0]NJO97861.1 hypothetical protein [Pleurocapsa sp. CRU_1_2]